MDSELKNTVHIYAAANVLFLIYAENNTQL